MSADNYLEFTDKKSLQESNVKLIDNFYRDIESLNDEEKKQEETPDIDPVGFSKNDINEYYARMMAELSVSKKHVPVDNDVNNVLKFQSMILKQLDFVDADPDKDRHDVISDFTD